MSIERREITSRDEWLEWRKPNVNASEVGALFNCHPYVTALRLFAEKRGTEFEQADNKAMRRGRWLESSVAVAVMEERPEWKLESAREYLRDPELRLGASPDFYVRNDPRGLGICETKTLAPSVYERDWGGGTEVPLWIILQGLTAAMLANADFIVIAALVVDAHNMDVSIHELPRNPNAEQRIKDAVAQFWGDVVIGREPEPDFSQDADTIKAMWRRESAPLVEIDLSGNNELPELLAVRTKLKERIKMAEARVEEIDAMLRFAMKDASVATGIPGWRMTLKTTDFKSYTVPARSNRILRISDQREKNEHEKPQAASGRRQ